MIIVTATFGFMRGKKEGITEGIQQGLQQGLQQGAYEKAIETAKNMLLYGDSVEKIAQITNLPLATIIELSNK